MPPSRGKTGPVPLAARGFDTAAEAYERGRPEYPEAAIAHLVRRLAIGPGRRVVELGAGTGKLTRALRPYGATLLPVEPSPGMRKVFRREVPGLRVRVGTAEAIPLPSGSADAVVAGQAFHWFRPGPTVRELRRVLRPGGGLGLVWNQRDGSVRWMAEFGRILHRHRGGFPDQDRNPWRRAIDGRHGFARLERTNYRTRQRIRPAALVDRAVSVSFIAAQPAAVRAEVADEVRALLRTTPATRGRRTIALPYRTELFVTHRV
jgi:SAM-dependent methyltransferase